MTTRNGRASSRDSAGTKLHPYVQLTVCVLGIYSSFLIWAICQERVSTTPYPSNRYPTHDKFRSVLFLNTIQSLFSSLSALLFLLSTRSKPGMSWSTLLGLPNDQRSSGIVYSNGKLDRHQSHSSSSSTALLKSYAFISLVSSAASPFGFLSLSHISFPTLLLGKSCKLIPVMLMNIILYRRKFPLHKYALVGLVTIGIWAFMAFKSDSSSGKGKGRESSSLLGMTLLGINLLLDGVVNSTQDEVFSKHPKVSGQQMMFFMNLFSTFITLSILLVPSFLVLSFLAEKGAGLNHFNALSSALSFISSHPGVIKDILLFSITGAIGQLFIFVTLSLYGSLTLVTITVTRKMVTMLLSVFIFDHKLSKGQWSGVALVFAAIGLEARENIRAKRRKEAEKKRIV